MSAYDNELYNFVTRSWLWGEDPVLQIRKITQRNNAVWRSKQEFLYVVCSLLTGGKTSAQVLREIVSLPGAIPITATDCWWKWSPVNTTGDAIEVAKMNIASLRLDVVELVHVLITVYPCAKAQFCGRPIQHSRHVVMDIINARWTHARAAWIAAVVCIAEPAPRPTKRLRNASGQYMKHA